MNIIYPSGATPSSLPPPDRSTSVAFAQPAARPDESFPVVFDPEPIFGADHWRRCWRVVRVQLIVAPWAFIAGFVVGRLFL